MANTQGLTTEQLAARCDRRKEHLISRGAMFASPAISIDVQFMTELLTELISPQDLDRARRRHLEWLDRLLDSAEMNMAKAALTQGIPVNGGQILRGPDGVG